MRLFVDPYTKQPLLCDEKNNLYIDNGDNHIVYSDMGGTYDFVHPQSNLAKEREHYDDEYRKLGIKHLSLADIEGPWRSELLPEHRILLESMGDISNKKVLLLGNGTSFKELYFAYLGADLVFTDLSVEAVNQIKTWFEASELYDCIEGTVEFHAVDALHLPFPENTFDVIYGCAFVHHIENLVEFLSEVNRCLKPGGLCRFLDDAYSPIWQWIKCTPFRKLQRYAHRKDGISPEDERATRRGGYREEEIRKTMREAGFKDLLFIRVSFFLRLAKRGYGKLISWDEHAMQRGVPFMKLAKLLDDFLAKTKIMKKNKINLVWGSKK